MIVLFEGYNFKFCLVTVVCVRAVKRVRSRTLRRNGGTLLWEVCVYDRRLG